MIRREPGNHLVDETAETPPVDVDSVSDFLDDFGRQVLRSAAYGHGHAIFWIEDFGEPEIGQFDVSVIVNYDILRFQAELGTSYSR